jgi:hypothetical protein
MMTNLARPSASAMLNHTQWSLTGCAPQLEVEKPQAVPHQLHQQPVWLTASLLELTQVRNVPHSSHDACLVPRTMCRSTTRQQLSQGKALLAARACSTCLVTRTVNDVP